MRACQICGVTMRVLFPVRIGTAVRWACEWCVRDRFLQEHIAAGLEPPDLSPGDPEDETHEGRDRRGKHGA